MTKLRQLKAKTSCRSSSAMANASIRFPSRYAAAQTSKASGITSGGQVYSRISYIGPIFRSPAAS